jgi:hypothetical protein
LPLERASRRPPLRFGRERRTCPVELVVVIVIVIVIYASGAVISRCAGGGHVEAGDGYQVSGVTSDW